MIADISRQSSSVNEAMPNPLPETQEAKDVRPVDIQREPNIIDGSSRRSNRAELREKAQALRRNRMKQWEIGQMLGVSQQTVSELLKEVSNDALKGDRSSRKMYAAGIAEAILVAVARGGGINARETPRRVFRRLKSAGVLRRSAIPRYYVLTDEAIKRLGSEREFNFIRFCLFDVHHFDRLSAIELERRLDQIREMWKLRTCSSSGAD